jgi:hypothetical protein
MLGELFAAHGIALEARDDCLVGEALGLCVEGWVVQEWDHGAAYVVQLDVRADVGAGVGHTIVESFGGFAENRRAAIANAVESFARGSLHVLLCLLAGEDGQVEQETWQADDGTRWRAILGNVLTRGERAGQAIAQSRFFDRLEGLVKARGLRGDLHWLRFYYAHHSGRTAACEVLLDNEAWPEAQSEMATCDWPALDVFYSVRVFMILQRL